jgi:hypothetical protein
VVHLFSEKYQLYENIISEWLDANNIIK